MTSSRNDVRSVSDICTHVKHLGYATSRRIRLYGEEFEVVSDPFPEANGVAQFSLPQGKTHAFACCGFSVTVLQCARKDVGRLRPIRLLSARGERGDKASMDKAKDQDRGEGATEENPQNRGAIPVQG